MESLQGFATSLISRSRGAVPCDSAVAIYREAARMLERVEKAPVRLIGVGVYNLSANGFRQLTLDELLEDSVHVRETETNRRLDFLRQKYRLDFAGHLEQLYHAETLHKTVEYILNPLNSNPLLAYTRQWDKVCDTSYFRAKNAEILSYFGVFTLLETAFMQ